MRNMRSQIQITYKNGPYTSICGGGSPINKFRTAAIAAGGGAAGGNANVCNNNAPETQFAISIELKVAESNGDRYWCLDYTGTLKGHPNSLGGANVCP